LERVIQTGGPQALDKIIPETCKAIYEALKHEYLKVRKLYICT